MELQDVKVKPEPMDDETTTTRVTRSMAKVSIEPRKKKASIVKQLTKAKLKAEPIKNIYMIAGFHKTKTVEAKRLVKECGLEWRMDMELAEKVLVSLYGSGQAMRRLRKTRGVFDYICQDAQVELL